MWSVRRRKFLPSKTKRKWRTAEKAANNSRSKVEYLTSAEESFLLKNARGDQEPELDSCCKTPPTCESEASTAKDIVAPGEG
jgi:hypothetical protein